MKIETVVLGMDFSDPAIHAARWVARHLAPESELILVHALEVPELPNFLRTELPAPEQYVESMREAARQKLVELCRSLDGARVRIDVRAGNATDAILTVVEETNADLVVVGEHGRRKGVLDALGSTAERLLHVSPAPVLLARGAHERPPAEILVPVEESDITPTVLEWAAALAQRFGAGITVLHVITSQIPGRVRLVSGSAASRQFEEKLLSSAQQWLDERTRAAGLDPERTTRVVVFGDTRWEILANAQRNDADLIIMGSRGSGTAGQLLLGSVARSVLRGAHCPVLVITGRSLAHDPN